MVQKARSVLIVEDERIVAKDLQQTVASLGYDAFALASSSSEAIAHASERCPDIVLMDIRIKGEPDGIETAAILKRRFDVPIVFLTAHADSATLERAKKTEPHGYLLKPIKPDELRTALEVSLYKHEMERRMRERERWLATTLRAIGDAVISTDAESRVTFLNPIAELLTGWTNEDAQGRALAEVLELVSEKERVPIEQPIAQALRDKKVVERVNDLLLIDKSGAEKPIADSAAPIVDDEKVLGAVMVFRDVTEQRRVQRQLEFSDRLASLGTMAAGVAHEINNPLGVIVANIDFVLETIRALPKKDGLDGVEEALVDMANATKRITQVSSDLNVFARPTDLRGTTPDVKRVIEWALQTTASELRHRARVVKEIEEVPALDLAEGRLVQVLVNVLLNAAQAIEPGKTDENEICITVRRQPPNRVSIEVRDTGAGIPPDVVPRVFDPFFTTRRPESTGLGLAVCHGIVKSAGGDIFVESVVGEGTAFRVVLPTAPERKERPSLRPSVRPPKRARVLVVDDDKLVAQALRRMLSKEHDPQIVLSAAEALNLIGGGETFEALVVDLLMPEMTGMDLYERLLASAPDQARRIVFATGGATTAKTADFLTAVPNVTLDKPILPRDLLDAIAHVIETAKQPRR